MWLEEVIIRIEFERKERWVYEMIVGNRVGGESRFSRGDNVSKSRVIEVLGIFMRSV